MDLIRLSITRPVSVLAVVLMVILFGIVELLKIPVQVIPDIHEPTVTVSTKWSGASPVEIEREILNRQEEALKGLEGVRSVSSSAQYGWAIIEIEFFPRTNTRDAALLVSNHLNQVGGYPTQAGRPRVWTANSDDEPIAMLVLSLLPGNNHPIEFYGDLVNNVVSDRLERIPGVASVSVYGGQSRELRVVIDPVVLSRYNLTVPQVADALRHANVATTIGEINEGKRRYVVRMTSELTTPERVKAVLLRSTEDDTQIGRVGRVMIGDIATEVDFAYKERSMNVRYLGHPAIALYITRKARTNVLEIMRDVKDITTELNEKFLKQEGLFLKLSYDETTFVNTAIDLVVGNIYIGGVFASVTLLLFLRSLPATLIIVSSIPISIVGAFIGMAVLGRTLNVISLTGIAFAVGMVVDAGIVVLENIFRLQQQGYPRTEAAYIGTSQVWGAILASALTTVMVFIPILTLELEIGQLFRDIAVALSMAVVVSLVVSVTVIPTLACRFLESTSERKKAPVVIPLLDDIGRLFVIFITNFINRVSASRLQAVLVIGTTTAVLVVTSWIFLPPLEYLPQSTYDMLSAAVKLPPGYNLDGAMTIASDIEKAVRFLWASETGPYSVPGQLPKFDTFFLRASRGGVYIEGTTLETKRIEELHSVIYEAVNREPGISGIVFQPTLFSGMGGRGRAIDLDVSGHDLGQVMEVAQRASALFSEWLPLIPKGRYLFTPSASLRMATPEVRILPDPLRLADTGVTAQVLSQTVSAFNDGLQVDEILVDGQRMNLVLYGLRSYITRTQDIGTLPVVTQSGRVLPVSTLADITITAGPTEIRHREQRRVVTLQIQPTDDFPLETAVEQVQTQVVDRLISDGLPAGITLNLSGAAGILTEAWNAMKWQLFLALSICYLLMALLYESFLYPLLVLITLPQATAGAVLGLVLFNLWKHQPLDMLTLLGFVILIGTVVNNAILIVHQTLHHIRVESMAVNVAITTAVRNRLRPIFMTTLTTLFGMLPLVVLPGAASELYRGLGTVVLGGLSLSAVLTLLILPPLLSLTAGTIEARRALHVVRSISPTNSDGRFQV